MRLALIDLDTIVYIIAYRQFEDGNRDQPELVKLHVRDFISNILVRVRADLVSMVYQVKGHNNFRKYFYPDYKSNRPEAPEFIKVWRDTILEEFENLGAVGVRIIESDDVLNIGYNRFKNEYELILISSDKDLNQIPGEHYNPKINVTYDVSRVDAIVNLYIQILGGDDSDGVKGLDGIGAKWNNKVNMFDAPRARKLLQIDPELQYDLAQYRKCCYDAYRTAYTETWYSEYLKTRFLVGLLAEIDYNTYPTNQEVPELFNIRQVSDFVVSNVFN